MRTHATSRHGLTRMPATRSVHPEPSIRGRREQPTSGAPLKLRVRVLMTRGRLDREIVSGAMSGNDDALALRVRQLTRERTRRKLAGNLRGVVEYVDRKGARPVITAVVVEPAAVRAGRRAILELAATLERSAPVEPRGIVLAQKLLTDGAGPLFNPGSDRNVSEAIWEIEDALVGDSTHDDGRAR